MPAMEKRLNPAISPRIEGKPKGPVRGTGDRFGMVLCESNQVLVQLDGTLTCYFKGPDRLSTLIGFLTHQLGFDHEPRP